MRESYKQLPPNHWKRRATEDVGLRLKAAREELRWSRRDVARHLGVSSYQLSKYEEGTQAIPWM